jgi:DHA1 family inner membrane transport protein
MIKDKSSYKLILLSLAISTFVIGCTEFITIGILPMMAKSLNVTVALAGLTVSLYALGVTLGGPIITRYFSHYPKKALILGILTTLIMGSLLSAFAPNFGVLLFARIFTSFAHGIFMSIGTVIAADISPEEKKASSIAAMFSGLTIATVVGVPIGTFIGNAWGWRVTFLFIALVGLLAFILNALFFPKNLAHEKESHFKTIVRLIFNKKSFPAFLLTAIGYGGTFVPFTYLSPILAQFGNFSPNSISWILMAYGIMIALGNIWGGKLSNKNPIASLVLIFIINTILLLCLSFIMISIHAPILLFIVVLIMGVFTFINVPGLQLYAMKQAAQSQTEGRNTMMLSALNISSFNLGIFGGSYIGQLTLKYLSLEMTGIVGGIIIFLSAILSFVLWKKEKKTA